MLEMFKALFSSKARDEQVQQTLLELREKMPVPVFWLLGKTQSGKTSIIRYLTGAEQAQIGNGFQPCTRFSRLYDFPTAEAPLIRFLDTRGLEEPGYDPTEDIAKFDEQAHLVVVTVRATDHAVEKLVGVVREIKQRRPRLPVLLVLTTLHEAYPQQQHPLPYPFDSHGQPLTDTLPTMLKPLWDCVVEHRRRFEGLADRVVLVDLTPREEGFNEADYGGPALREALHDLLPSAVGQTLARLDEATLELRDLYERQAMPYILSYSSLAASAGAIPIPIIDVVLLAGIQSRMVYDLAKVYGQPMTGQRFLELGSTIGLGLLTRQAIRSLTKIIPFFGSVAAGALAGASTYALGRAFCHYYRAVHQGHVPRPEDLRKYYEEELARVQQSWMGNKPTEPADTKRP
jgi:uncharacterized protein (DUF697 family)